MGKKVKDLSEGEIGAIFDALDHPEGNNRQIATKTHQNEAPPHDEMQYRANVKANMRAMVASFAATAKKFAGKREA